MMEEGDCFRLAMDYMARSNCLRYPLSLDRNLNELKETGNFSFFPAGGVRDQHDVPPALARQ
jgi:hypothetical protein